MDCLRFEIYEISLKSIKIITLFPDFFRSPLSSSLLGKAIESKIIEVEVIDLRAYAENRFHRCDDYPYGGGSGMVLMPGPLFRAIKSNTIEKTEVILTTPSGVSLDQNLIKELTEKDNLCIICGHYEGVDQRIIDKFVDYELSIGDYILSGGEYAALVILDAISRLIPGFMSNPDSLKEESFQRSLLEYPQYTRPREFEGQRVPEILVSGDHERIRKWRLEKSIEKTRRVRPDLYDRYLRMGE